MECHSCITVVIDVANLVNFAISFSLFTFKLTFPPFLAGGCSFLDYPTLLSETCGLLESEYLIQQQLSFSFKVHLFLIPPKVCVLFYQASWNE